LLVLATLAGCHDHAAAPDAPYVIDAIIDTPVPIDALACIAGTACGSAGLCLFSSCTTRGVNECVEPVTMGTCTSMNDSDGDGLLDEWELAGYIDLNCNGVNDGEGVDVQLPGAHVNFPDVYLEIDYMLQAGTGASCTDDSTCQAAVPGEQCVAGACTHSHQPKMSSLDAVQTAASRGFYLHYDLVHMDAILETPVVAFDTSNAACVGPGATSFFALKNAHFYSGTGGPTSAFALERRLVYHYAIFGHYATCPPDASGLGTYCDTCTGDRGLGVPQPGATGTAEMPGNDFIVSLGGLYFGFPNSVARPRSDISEGGTLLHELGHNLGLGHGVSQTGPHVPSANGPLYSPIYFSVMNYNYQTRGVLHAASPGGGTPATSQIDFSAVDTCVDLDEAALDESVGAACGASTDLVVSYFADVGGAAHFASAQTGTAIDWNGDGSIATASDNLNANVSSNSTEVFRSMNDWLNLQYNSRCYQWTLSDGVAPAAATSSHELTSPEIVRRSSY
jgi:hypothetical protein